MSDAKQPLQPARTAQFKRDLDLCRRRGCDMDLARVIMGRLIHRRRLARKHKDHPLKGEDDASRPFARFVLEYVARATEGMDDAEPAV